MIKFTRKIYFILFLGATSLGFSTECIAQTALYQLGKISRVTTLVAYDKAGPPPNGITETRLRTLVELRLRSAGLQVIGEDEKPKEFGAIPYVYLHVSSIQIAQAGLATGFAYAARMSVRTAGFVSLNGSRAPLELWANSTLGTGPTGTSNTEMENMVHELLDSLINQWLKDNPKR